MSLVQDKLSAINRLLSEEYFLCHVNPRTSGTLLPPHLMAQSTVTLKLSRHFQGKFEITETCIAAELSFNKQLFSCTVPFEAIWGVTSIKGTNFVWHEAMPPGVAVALKPGDKAPLPKTAETPKKGGHLKRVK